MNGGARVHTKRPGIADLDYGYKMHANKPATPIEYRTAHERRERLMRWFSAGSRNTPCCSRITDTTGDRHGNKTE
ncbi:hypothetical protein PMI06_009914, partial [Burkholderia sp. BT03]